MPPKFLAFLIAAVVVLSGVFVSFADVPVPKAEDIRYGVTFSVFRANELKLEWREAYNAILDDLHVRRLRLIAHWPLVEPEQDVFSFDELDYQMKRAEEVGAEVILSVGRRLPSWPECHIPKWALDLSPEERDAQIFEYVKTVVNRYKSSPALKWWQVENEPFIIGFAYQNCGEVDPGFLDIEIGFVQAHDPDHPVLLTASGELGLWNNTWSRAGVFGTTLYRHVYNADLKNFITYPTTPGFFRFKRALTELTVPNPGIPAIISELAAEPWPIQPIVETPLEEQLTRMNIDRLNKTIEFAAKSSFDEQYLWGAEWWYYLKEVQGVPDVWEWARPLFQ